MSGKKKKTQSYIFAYEAMPGVFRGNAEKYLDILEQDGLNFLEFWWEHVAELYDLEAEGLIPSDGLTFEIRKDENIATVVIITMPIPKKHGEAYFLALVHPKQKRTFFKWENNPRVFTLSLKQAQDDVPQGTIMGEWTPRRKFFPSEVSPAPELDAFYQAVLALMTKK
jgi:hypothetical protein